MDSPAQARVVLGPFAKVIRGELVFCQVEDWVALTVLLGTVAVLELHMGRAEKDLTHNLDLTLKQRSIVLFLDRGFL